MKEWKKRVRDFQRFKPGAGFEMEWRISEGGVCRLFIDDKEIDLSK